MEYLGGPRDPFPRSVGWLMHLQNTRKTISSQPIDWGKETGNGSRVEYWRTLDCKQFIHVVSSNPLGLFAGEEVIEASNALR